MWNTNYSFYHLYYNFCTCSFFLNIYNISFNSDNIKPKKPVDLAILKNDQDLLDTEDDSLDSDEDDDKDDLDDLADDTELADDPNIEEDEEDDDDEYDDSDQDWDVKSSSTSSTPKPTTSTTTTTTTTFRPTTIPTPDPYFTHFDPRNEHQSYKEAQVTIYKQKITNIEIFSKVWCYPL